MVLPLSSVYEQVREETEEETEERGRTTQEEGRPDYVAEQGELWYNGADGPTD